MKDILKDEKLSEIISNDLGNIAQFVSIGPDKTIRFVQIENYSGSKENIRNIVIELINSSKSKRVNIRSFSIDKMKGNKLFFDKSIEDIDDIINVIYSNCAEGKYSIVNENISINDGGVSGVVLGDIIEFSPKDTPKCVDKEGTCLLSKEMGYSILETVYGFSPSIAFDLNYRVEFSIHPKREGVLNEHTIIWEYEKFDNYSHKYKIKWPNNFSRFIGDKTFGLLVSDYLGFDVPFTTVISREVAPFSFGKATGLSENWIRTCPIVKESGKFYSGNKWEDPFMLMNKEEKKGDFDINIAALLSQSAVDAIYSGGAIVADQEEDDIIEGVFGNGDNFMVGQESNTGLPIHICKDVKKILEKLRSFQSILGNVSIEWVHDGDKVWVVQMNQLENYGKGLTIVEGNPDQYIKFNVSDGLENLRLLIKEISHKNLGITLVGDVGITSHFGDLLRQSSIPSFIESRR